MFLRHCTSTDLSRRSFRGGSGSSVWITVMPRDALWPLVLPGTIQNASELQIHGSRARKTCPSKRKQDLRVQTRQSYIARSGAQKRRTQYIQNNKEETSKTSGIERNITGTTPKHTYAQNAPENNSRLQGNISMLDKDYLSTYSILLCAFRIAGPRHAHA